MKKRLIDEQTIGMLEESVADAKVVELCRKYAIAEAMYYNCKAKYGDMAVPGYHWLKAQEAENSKLERLPAEWILNNSAFKDVVR